MKKLTETIRKEPWIHEKNKSFLKPYNFYYLKMKGSMEFIALNFNQHRDINATLLLPIFN